MINKKKIYCLRLGGDFGELWLDENKNPLSHVDCNDARFRSEYQKFIIDYLGGELIDVQETLIRFAFID